MIDVNSDALNAAWEKWKDTHDIPSCGERLKLAIKAYEAAKPIGCPLIESAPRDGRKILGFDENAPHVGWHVTQWKNQDWFSDAHPHRSWWPQPTHWLPLPAPPIDSSAPNDSVTP